MKKTVQFLTLGFFAVMVIGVCATPRGGEKTNPTQAKLDAWRRGGNVLISIILKQEY